MAFIVSLCRAVVIVKVEDIDRYAPVFDKTTYFAEMEEEKMYDSIVKVSANDNDEAAENKGICGYDILDDDVPFVIDNEGRWIVRSLSDPERFCVKLRAIKLCIFLSVFSC